MESVKEAQNAAKLAYDSKLYAFSAKIEELENLHLNEIRKSAKLESSLQVVETHLAKNDEISKYARYLGLASGLLKICHNSFLISKSVYGFWFSTKSSVLDPSLLFTEEDQEVLKNISALLNN